MCLSLSLFCFSLRWHTAGAEIEGFSAEHPKLSKVPSFRALSRTWYSFECFVHFQEVSVSNCCLPGSFIFIVSHSSSNVTCDTCRKMDFCIWFENLFRHAIWPWRLTWCQIQILAFSLSVPVHFFAVFLYFIFFSLSLSLSLSLSETVCLSLSVCDRSLSETHTHILSFSLCFLELALRTSQLCFSSFQREMTMMKNALTFQLPVRVTTTHALESAGLHTSLLRAWLTPRSLS